jgi:hypothetical protein
MTTTMRATGRGTRRGGVLKGCLIAVAILVLLAVVAGVVVAMNWRSWASAGFQTVSDQMVAAMPISDAERGEVKPLMDGMIAEFKAGTLSMQEFGQVMQQLETGPLLSVMGAGVIGAQYITPSALSDEEKAAANLEIGRVARGLQEGSIAQGKLAEITAPIQGMGGVQIQVGTVQLSLKNPGECTPEELRTLVANAKAAADAASVPAEAYAIDASTEIERMFTQAIGRVPGRAATP